MNSRTSSWKSTTKTTQIHLRPIVRLGCGPRVCVTRTGVESRRQSSIVLVQLYCECPSHNLNVHSAVCGVYCGLPYRVVVVWWRYVGSGCNGVLGFGQSETIAPISPTRVIRLATENTILSIPFYLHLHYTHKPPRRSAHLRVPMT